MIVEHLQLLSTALHLLNVDDPNLYKMTHKNHPCAIWVRQSRVHYHYLIELTQELMKEYTVRYGKVHKCESDGKIDTFLKYAYLIPDNGWIDPPQCMPDECKLPDVVDAYRNYYKMKKQDILQWKTENPDWL